MYLTMGTIFLVGGLFVAKTKPYFLVGGVGACLLGAYQLFRGRKARRNNPAQ